MGDSDIYNWTSHLRNSPPCNYRIQCKPFFFLIFYTVLLQKFLEEDSPHAGVVELALQTYKEAQEQLHERL